VSGNSKPSNGFSAVKDLFCFKENKIRFDSQEPNQNDRLSICPPVNPIKIGKFKAGRTVKRQTFQVAPYDFNSDSNSSSGCSTAGIRKKLGVIGLRGTKV
jgi:hypothetical protein